MLNVSGKNFLVVLTLLFSTMPRAWAGNSGGGGNGLHSSVGQVKSAINILHEYDYTGAVFREIEKEMNQKGEALHISNPRVREVFAKMLGAGFPPAGKSLDIQSIPVLADIEKTKFILKEDGPCKDLDGKDQDASVAAYQLGSDVCFSIPRLRRYAPKHLTETVMALGIHEFAHQFGFKDETQVRAVQGFVYDHIFNNCRMNIYFAQHTTSDESIWHRFVVSPREWADGPDTTLGDVTKAKYELTYTKVPGEVSLTAFNYGNDFQMEIYRNKESYVKFLALNSDLTKTPVEIHFKPDFTKKSEWEVGMLFAYPKKTSMTVTGTYDGKPFPALEDLEIDAECFYGTGSEIY